MFVRNKKLFKNSCPNIHGQINFAKLPKQFACPFIQNISGISLYAGLPIHSKDTKILGLIAYSNLLPIPVALLWNKAYENEMYLLDHCFRVSPFKE